MPLTTTYLEDTFTSKEEGIKRLLSNILNLNLQHESNEKSIINTINRLLSTAKYRKEGLEYLNLIIDSCSSSVIAENALNWINHCIIKFPDDILRELKLRVLGEIVEISHDESDFNKKFVSDYVSKVFDICITSRVNPYECKTALKTLTVTMKCYPSWFGPQRQKIENFILIFLDNEDTELVQAAASAFHCLQQVGGAGSNGVNHKVNFTQNFHKLCRTVHKLYSKLFENERELFYTETTGEETFEFEDDPSQSSQALLHINARRIRNVFKFIETMIRTKFPVAKETKPQLLLEIITRGTSIHKCITGDSAESLETYQFSLLLLEIQSAALRLLRLFIVWYKTNCLPFSYAISKALVDSLERSHDCDCYKSDSLYQESAYRALCEWISIAKSSLHPQFQAQLLECILKDITPVKTQITLTITDNASGKKSQKAKRKAMANRIISSGNQSSTKESATPYEKWTEKNSCQFALTSLRCLLESTGLNVKTNLLKDLYHSIFDSLINLQTGKSSRPYTDPRCQAKLYEVLVAIYHQNTLSILPPLHTSLDLLNRGANSNNSFVASICHKGLRILEALCQPVCPSLYLGSEKEADDEEDVQKPGLGEDEEIDADVCERNSVDFDASTDEFPSHNISSQDVPYHVRLTYSDRSSIDDALSDKVANSEEIEVEEVSFDITQTVQHHDDEMNISEHPLVTAPSEDGNEILEGHIKEGTVDSQELGPIQEEEDGGGETIQEVADQGQEISDSNKDSNQEIDGSKEEDSATAEENVVESNTITKSPNNSSEVEEINDNEAESVKNPEATLPENPADAPPAVEDEQVSNSGQIDSEQLAATVVAEDQANEQEVSNSDQKDWEAPASERAKPMAEEDVFVESTENKDSAPAAKILDTNRDDPDVECEEPAAKKAKLMSEGDMDDVFVEGSDEQDPDDCYLEYDSFVDEVNDYY